MCLQHFLTALKALTAFTHNTFSQHSLTTLSHSIHSQHSLTEFTHNIRSQHSLTTLSHSLTQDIDRARQVFAFIRSHLIRPQSFSFPNSIGRFAFVGKSSLISYASGLFAALLCAYRTRSLAHLAQGLIIWPI